MMHKNSLFDLDINTYSKYEGSGTQYKTVMLRTKLHESNQSFNLVVKSQGHSDLILILDTHSCPKKYSILKLYDNKQLFDLVVKCPNSYTRHLILRQNVSVPYKVVNKISTV